MRHQVSFGPDGYAADLAYDHAHGWELCLDDLSGEQPPDASCEHGRPLPLPLPLLLLLLLLLLGLVVSLPVLRLARIRHCRRLGLDYATLSKEFPSLVYAHLSAW